MGRLASIEHDLAGTARDVTFSYGYNPAGQIASRTTSNDAYAAAVSNANQSDTHNGLNQIVTASGATVGHDAKGNITSEPSVPMTYGYSSENLLTSATGPYGNGTLTYDPVMRLWDSGTGGRTRVLHDGEQRIAEYSQAGGQRNRVVFGPGMDEPLIEYSGSGLATVRYLYADERGSIAGGADAAGNSVGVGTYDDYGQSISFASGRFGYAGQPYETVSDLQYSRARFYNPRRGRFMQPDPIGYGDGMNPYGYVGGDPVNRIDPMGLRDDPVHGGEPEIVVCGGVSYMGRCLSVRQWGIMMQLENIGIRFHPNIFNPQPINWSEQLNCPEGLLCEVPLPPPPPPPSSCTNSDAFKNSGAVRFSGTSFGVVPLIGVGRTTGQFSTESGIAGNFTATEFAVGLRADVGSITGRGTNLSAFGGWGDTTSSGIDFLGGSDDVSTTYGLDGKVTAVSTSVAGRSIGASYTGGFGYTSVRVTSCQAR